jgi:hypothetical protein
VRNPFLEYVREHDMSAPMVRAWVASILVWGAAVACGSLGVAALILGDSNTAVAVGIELLIVGGWLAVAPFSNLMRVRPSPGFITFGVAMILLAVIAGLVFRNPWLPLFFMDIVIVGSVVVGVQSTRGV